MIIEAISFVPAWIQALFIFFAGALTGSFLNVCVYRLPRGESVVFPRSHCPACSHLIRWYDNIPFLSYILLRATCRSCGTRISPRYMIIEFSTAAAFLGLFLRYGYSLDFLAYTVFVCCLIVATFVDFSHRIIPDEISLGGTAAGLAFAAAAGFSGSPFSWSFFPLVRSCLGAITGAGSIFLIGFVFDMVYFRLLRKPAVEGETQSMGGGDVKLMAMVGAFLGWKMALLTFFLAPFLGITVGIVNLVTRKSHLIPYGPFLSLAAVVSLLYGDQLLHLFFRPIFFY